VNPFIVDISASVLTESGTRSFLFRTASVLWVVVVDGRDRVSVSEYIFDTLLWREIVVGAPLIAGLILAIADKRKEQLSVGTRPVTLFQMAHISTEYRAQYTDGVGVVFTARNAHAGGAWRLMSLGGNARFCADRLLYTLLHERYELPATHQIMLVLHGA